MIPERRIDVTLTLGQGQWGQTLGDSVTLTGYRVRAQLEQWVGNMMPHAQIEIFDVPVEIMNRVTTIGPVAWGMKYQNTVTLTASTDSGMATFFSGKIASAWAQMQEAPDVALAIEGYIGLGLSLQPVNAANYKGSVPVAQMMQDFANQANLNFSNNGVTATIRNQSFPGTVLARIQQCAAAAQIFYTIDHETLAIWPKGGYRARQTVPVISPQNGMLGYPQYSEQGVTVRRLASTDISVGDQFTIQGSILTPANRTWVAYAVSHTLETQSPEGPWFTDTTGYLSDLPNG